MKLTNKTIHRLKQKYGKWVLITGATSGIGKELALKFGEAGFNMVITGRREQLLNDLSSELFDQHRVEVIHACNHLPIGIAVLNAGFGTSGKFIDADIKQEVNLLDLNCKSLLILTHHFANKMKEQSQKGAIVLMSSMVAFQGVPNAANYAASKAYVQSLGEALAIELKEEGVDILNAAPGPVKSGFSERANMKMDMSLKPEDVGCPSFLP